MSDDTCAHDHAAGVSAPVVSRDPVVSLMLISGTEGLRPPSPPRLLSKRSESKRLGDLHLALRLRSGTKTLSQTGRADDFAREYPNGRVVAGLFRPERKPLCTLKIP